MLKDTNDHCHPCVLTKEAPTPTEGVLAPHMPLGTCAHHHIQQSSRRSLRAPPVPNHGRLGSKTEDPADGPQEHLGSQGHRNKDSGPCRTSFPPPEFAGTCPTHHCYPDVTGGWLATARAAHFFPCPHPYPEHPLPSSPSAW